MEQITSRGEYVHEYELKYGATNAVINSNVRGECVIYETCLLCTEKKRNQ